MSEKLTIEELNNLIDEIEKENNSYNKLTLEQLYSLMNEIEKNENLYAKELRTIKEKRKAKKRNSKCKIKLAIMCSIILLSKIKTYNFNTPFLNNKLIMSTSTKEKIINSLEQKYHIAIPQKEKESYILLNAINQNNNLTEEEKEQIFSLVPLISDNNAFDKQNAYETLQKLSIEYVDKETSPANNIIGQYIYPDHAIKIYLSKKEDINDEVLKHELIHSIYYSTFSSKIPTFIEEGMTEFLLNEYFSLHPYIEYNNYPYEILLNKLLFEIVGEENVLKSFCTGKMNYIYDYMDSLHSNKKDAEILLTSLDKILENYSNNELFSKEELIKLINELEKYYHAPNEKQHLNAIDIMNINNNKKIDNAFYYYKNAFLTILASDPGRALTNYIIENGILKKLYFSEYEYIERIEKNKEKKLI